MARTSIRMTGQKHGRWTVIGDKPDSTTKSGARWLCRCECGVERVVMRVSLVTGASTSCGCFQRETVRACNRKEERGVLLKHLWRKLNASAKSRGLTVTLSQLQWLAITQQPCYICGAQPAPRTISVGKYKGHPYVYTVEASTVDRLDSHIGYTPDNSKPCCEMCNRMKLHYPLNEFLAHIGRIQNHTGT